jgi:hypothetical protein
MIDIKVGDVRYQADFFIRGEFRYNTVTVEKVTPKMVRVIESRGWRNTWAKERFLSWAESEAKAREQAIDKCCEWLEMKAQQIQDIGASIEMREKELEAMRSVHASAVLAHAGGE